MVNASMWQTEYVDTDWSTTFRWSYAGLEKHQAGDKNVITALFDVIAASMGVRFDYEKAQQLYESGDLELPQSLYDVIDGSGRIERQRR